MRFKRLLALLAAAALALSLLAGCGNGSKALSDVIADLLSGLYDNVAVEVDPDLTAALKKAAAEGGTEEEILSRMIEILNLNNVSITFTRLGSGQQGDHAVTLYFQAGTDPDAAARNALAQWASTLGTLPDDGSFQGDVAMIEANNGYYVALDVEVLKAGKPDKDDEPDKPANGLTYDSANKSAIISGENGLASLVDTLQKVADESGTTLAETIGETNITLTSDATLPENWPDGLVYTASFDGGNHTVSGVDGSGMFGEIAADASVKNVNFTEVAVNGSGRSGTVAATNNGTVDNCHVLSGSVSGGNLTGGLVGYNPGTISNSSAACSVEGGNWVGGIAGENGSNAITNCEVTEDVTGTGKSIGGIVGYSAGAVGKCTVSGNVESLGTGDDNAGWYVGGIVGASDGSVTDCKMTGNVISSNGSEIGGIVGENWNGTVTHSSCAGNVEGSNNVGGVVGYNNNEVIACYSTGYITGTNTNGYCQVGGVIGGNSSTGTVDSCYAQGTVESHSQLGYIGGVVGHNNNMVKGCYSSCTVKGSKDVGGVAGVSNGSILGCFATGTITFTDSGTTGGLVGEIYTGSVQGCYWSNNIGKGAGSDQYQGGEITKIGSQQTDGTTVTWGIAVDAMNAASGASVKFINNDTSVPTLPIS